MLGSVLSPILCNIYLHELDNYVVGKLIPKYSKGNKPVINPVYRKNIGLKEYEKRLPLHLQSKIKRTRSRSVDKQGIKRILESEQFVRIKYVRYVDDFLIGVQGSRDLATKIRDLINNFLGSKLHLSLNLEKTKVTDTYSSKAYFLGMVIQNKKAQELPYQNSREIENMKRVKRRNKVAKMNKLKQINRFTREKIMR